MNYGFTRICDLGYIISLFHGFIVTRYNWSSLSLPHSPAFILHIIAGACFSGENLVNL